MTNRYSLGSTGPGGGIVFYDASEVQKWGQFLEFAPEMWGQSTTSFIFSWCDDENADLDMPGTQDAIGTGYANSLIIANRSSESAAAKCLDFRGGGLSDWFLPSEDELLELWRKHNDLFEDYGRAYWTSTQSEVDGVAWAVDKDGGRKGFRKGAENIVWPIRAF